ncbi:MAG: pyridoxal phosphate-dependent aminotransferase [Deltaproteobacteria bacterium]|jgi:aspartate aminotransferase|nr:pyridoxal phosphate-dependent aminotransferase [Deltaproteobacteria bacterium]
MHQLLAKRFEHESSMEGSMIRKMFDLGMELREQYGDDYVCDFSIGNPDVPPPLEVKQALHEIAEQADEPFFFSYMNAAGYPWVRQRMAAEYSQEQGVKLEAEDVFMATGAAGALSTVFRAVLNPGEEVLGIKPFFGDYITYLQNSDGRYVGVALKPDFTLDIPAMEAAVTSETRIVLINSPHNPTGAIFAKSELEALVAMLRRKNEELGRPILLLSDEPYRVLVYGDTEVPSVFPLYEWSVVVGSFAKNISMPGERIGYIIVNPDMPGKESFMRGVARASSIMGYVNTTTLGLHLLKRLLGKKVDIGVYARRREAMARALREAGYEFNMPNGAFYFFPKSPLADDVKFVEDILVKHRILGVGGTAFGMPGYFRLSFCVSEDVINRAAAGFKKAMDEAIAMK